MKEKRWHIKSRGDNTLVNRLMSDLNVNDIIANLLVQRGIYDFNSAKDFFRPNLSNLHDPFLMRDMDKAVNRLEQAFINREKIMILGDYDVDGTTAVSLVYGFLSKYLAKEYITYYIPNRYTEGYGISYQAIDFAAENHYSLIIALDCGIKAIDKIDYANNKRIDFIICDHHRPGDELPKAVAILDPKRKDCEYPYKDLSGCGVGFKLLTAWCIKNNIALNELYNYLDLVAVSIAADIVPIKDENRILTHFGLQKLNSNPSKGLKAIIELTKLKRQLSVSDIVFTVGPRINAAGRLETGTKAVELLLANDDELATNAGIAIQKTNYERQTLDKSITEEAFRMIENNGWHNRKSTVLFNPQWHKGVIGIVASRLTDKYYRPTIMLTESNGLVAGSARSVKNFDVYEAIENCSDLLIQFGGHKYAAGLTLERKNVDAFIERFEQVVSKTISDELLIPEIEIDYELNFSDITPKFIRIIKQFAPFGPENLSPIFVTNEVKTLGYPKQLGENHLRFEVYQPNNPTLIFSAIAFNLIDKMPIVNSPLPYSICYSIEENEWNGTKTIQLNIKDIKALN
jgi:single-stranded-DNA-specific exonuclease